MEKQFFTPKRIREAFDIEPRRLTYLVELGHVVADVQDLGERGLVRLYSPREAVKVGLICLFESQGFVLDRAVRLAEVAVTAPRMCDLVRHQLYAEPHYQIDVINGWHGALQVIFTADDGSKKPLLFGFHVAKIVTGEEAHLFEADKKAIESSCTYNISLILARQCAKLGIEVKDINAPESGLVCEATEDSGLFWIKFND